MLHHKLIEQPPDEGRACEAPQSRRQTDLGQYCSTLKRSAGGRIRPVSETKEVRIGVNEVRIGVNTRMSPAQATVIDWVIAI
jgi:hypothetical protein